MSIEKIGMWAALILVALQIVRTVLEFPEQKLTSVVSNSSFLRWLSRILRNYSSLIWAALALCLAVVLSVEATRRELDRKEEVVFLVIRAEGAYSKRDFQSAMEKYGRALEISPTHYFINRRMGDCARLLGRLAEAESFYRESLKHRPGYVQGRFALGINLQEQGKYDESIDEFDIVRQSREHGTDLLYHTGKSYYRKWKDNERAGKDLFANAERVYKECERSEELKEGWSPWCTFDLAAMYWLKSNTGVVSDAERGLLKSDAIERFLIALEKVSVKNKSTLPFMKKLLAEEEDLSDLRASPAFKKKLADRGMGLD